MLCCCLLLHTSCILAPQQRDSLPLFLDFFLVVPPVVLAFVGSTMCCISTMVLLLILSLVFLTIHLDTVHKNFFHKREPSKYTHWTNGSRKKENKTSTSSVADIYPQTIELHPTSQPHKHQAIAPDHSIHNPAKARTIAIAPNHSIHNP